jgi:hypothetical protein
MDYEFFLRLVARQPLMLVDDVVGGFTLLADRKRGRLRRGPAFVYERRRVSAAYWGPCTSAAHWRRRWACDRHLADHFANTVLRAHQDEHRLDWWALGRMLRWRPTRLFERHVLGVLAECILGRRMAAAVRGVVVRST